jgi:hypothetical protein
MMVHRKVVTLNWRTVVLVCLLVAVSCETIVSIDGTQFYINNKLTNAGSPAAGLLINSRMTQV